MTTTTDKIWEAIQRPSPAVTREEIEAIVEAGMSDAVTLEATPMTDGALELLTAISKAVDKHGLRVILDPRALIPFIPAAAAAGGVTWYFIPDQEPIYIGDYVRRGDDGRIYHGVSNHTHFVLSVNEGSASVIPSDPGTVFDITLK